MRWKSMWISYFNPLPRKEGDQRNSSRLRRCTDFNPLPRKEGDTKSKEAARQKAISIHSLVKRETLVFMPEMPPEMDFNPLPRKEGDI